MSAFFKLKLDGQEREIEVTREGELVFPGYDWEQDDLMVFMTGQRSEVRKFFDDWQENPTKIICFNLLPMQKPDLLMISADWAEHILRLVQKRYSWFLGWPENINSRLIGALDLVRNLSSGNLKDKGRYELKQIIGNTESEVNGIKKEIEAIAASFDVSEGHQVVRPKMAYQCVVEAVLSTLGTASWILENITYDFMVIMCALGAADHAAAASRYFYQDQEEGGEGEARAERSWQVRHFVHAMECIQAGKKWPDIKGTP
jgi:hypothetical protein